MDKISILDLQKLISKIDHKNNSIDKYFYKLSEEVGELAKAIRKNKRLKDTNTIKETIEEELYDILYYVICLANMYDVNLEECMFLKEKINAEKYNRKSIFEDEEIQIKSKINTNKKRKLRKNENEFEEEITSKLLEAEQEMAKNSKRYTSEEVLERLKKSIE